MIKIGKGEYYFNLLLAGVISIACLYYSIWQFRFLPWGDLPLHIYMAHIISHVSSFKAYYYIQWELYPNQIWQWVLAGLQLTTTPIIATKLLLTFHLVSGSLSLYLIFKKFNPHAPPLIFLIFLFAQFNFFYQMGYLQYTLTVGLIPYMLLLLIKLDSNTPAKSLTLAAATAVFFLMHFMGLIALYFCCFLYEIQRFETKNAGQRLASYIPSFVIFLVLVMLTPEAANDGPLLSYDWHKKIGNFGLLLFRPLPFQAILFASVSIAALPSLINHIRTRRSFGATGASLLAGILIYIITPSSIKKMEDADLRVLYPLSIYFLMITLSIHIKRPQKQIVKGPLLAILVTTPLFAMFLHTLATKQEDILDLQAMAPGTSPPILVNYNLPESIFKKLTHPTGDSLFYLFAYQDYLMDSKFTGHAPFVFSTSILSRTAPYTKDQRQLDLILPWGDPISQDAESAKKTLLHTERVFFPKFALKNFSWLTRDREILKGSYWALAVKRRKQLSK